MMISTEEFVQNVKLGDQGIEIPVDSDDEYVLILLEQLVGDEKEVIAWMGETEGRAKFENVSQTGKVHAFIGKIDEPLDKVTIWVSANVIRQVRFSILKIKKYFRKKVNGLECRFCKSVAGWLLKAGLAAAGIPFLDEGLDWAGDVAEKLAGVLDKSAHFADLVKAIDLGIWEGIMATLAGLDWAFELTDKLYELVCEQLKFCP
ncbi:MAG: hypothetical protein HQ494_10245 [Rhodospirillales bacterium]|nr:hypothetical protein [Rhodospirillales bacterium]